MYDLIIRNGTVIDGSGKPGYVADIAVKDGKIVQIGSDLTGSSKEINAFGLTVTPGFVDSHSHSDNNMLEWPDQIEKIEQGITLSVAGQCGGTKSPVSRDATAENTSDVAGFGKEADVYRTVSGFLDIAEKVPQGSNIVTFVGHRALRQAVMGLEKRAPTDAEMARMKELLIDGIVHGAMGISFGLIYPPGCYAETDELIELAKTAAEHGGLVAAHIRNEGPQVIEAVEEFIAVIRGSGARGVLSHHKSSGKGNWGKVKTTLQMLDSAVEEGLDIYCDVYPYTASSTSLAVTLIPKELHTGGQAGLSKLLSDPAKREEIKAWNRARRGAEDDLSWILITLASAYPQYEGKRLHEIAAIHGTDVYDAAFDLIQSGYIGACYFTMCEEDVKTVLAHPRAMICTDSGVARDQNTYHPRLRGTFPRVLGRYVRQEKVVPLEEMIRKMTSLPAEVYGLSGKGLIREGFDADICIFDAEKIIDRADYAACYLRAEGLHYVILSGQIVVENAVYNGIRAGRLYRRPFPGLVK